MIISLLTSSARRLALMVGPLWIILLQGFVSCSMALESVCCLNFLLLVHQVSSTTSFAPSLCAVCTAWMTPSSRRCRCPVSLHELDMHSYLNDMDASRARLATHRRWWFPTAWGFRLRLWILLCVPLQWCPSCISSSKCTSSQRKSLSQEADLIAVPLMEGTLRAVHLPSHRRTDSLPRSLDSKGLPCDWSHFI